MSIFGFDSAITSLGNFGASTFSFSSYVIPIFPPRPPTIEEGGSGMLCIEILHPIVPNRTRNKIVFRDDNKKWQGVQKSEFRWGHEFVTLKYRIHDVSYMKTFFNALKTNGGRLVRLTTNGVQPFLRSSESNLVYIKGFSRPVKEKAQVWSVNVTYLLNPNPLT